MIDRTFLDSLGLTKTQAAALMDALTKERDYRKILLQEGVGCETAETIIRGTQLEDVDLSNEELLRLKTRIEWGGKHIKRHKTLE